MRLIRLHGSTPTYFQLGGVAGPEEQWHVFLKLCLMGGWKPDGAEMAKGTVNGLPNTLDTLAVIHDLPVTDPCLSYLSVGARVGAMDALQMSQAANDMLPDIPPLTVAAHKAVQEQNPLEFWSGVAPRITLENLIEWLQQGGFNAMPDNWQQSL